MASLTSNARVILESVEILSEHYWKESVKFSKMEHLFGTDFANICKYLHVLRVELKLVFFQGSRICKIQVFSSCLCKWNKSSLYSSQNIQLELGFGYSFPPPWGLESFPQSVPHREGIEGYIKTIFLEAEVNRLWFKSACSYIGWEGHVRSLSTPQGDGCSPKCISWKAKWEKMIIPRDSKIPFATVSSEGLGVTYEWIPGHLCGGGRRVRTLELSPRAAGAPGLKVQRDRWERACMADPLSF